MQPDTAEKTLIQADIIITDVELAYFDTPESLGLLLDRKARNLRDSVARELARRFDREVAP